MAKFNYRMQNILDLKYKLEDQERMAFAMANEKLNEENEKLKKLILRRAMYEAKAKELVSGTLDFKSINENRHAIEVMKSHIRSQMIAVKNAENAVDIQRKKLNDVMIERKSQEKLKEKAFDGFKQELSQAEAKEIDELVSFTHGSK